jgi:hypothetical protein
MRLQLIDVENKLTEFEPRELRIEPLGVDSNGNKLWYFGDLRLYQELPPPPPPPSPPRSRNSRKSKKRNNKSRQVTPASKKTSVRKAAAQSQRLNASSALSNKKSQNTKNKKNNRGRSLKSKKSSSSDEDDEDDDDEEDFNEPKIEITYDELDEDLNNQVEDSINNNNNDDDDDEDEDEDENDDIDVNDIPVKELNGQSRRGKDVVLKNQAQNLNGPSRRSNAASKLGSTVKPANESGVGLRRSSRRSTRLLKEEEDDEQEQLNVDIESQMDQPEEEDTQSKGNPISNEQDNINIESETSNDQVNTISESEIVLMVKDESVKREIELQIKEEEEFKCDIKEEESPLSNASSDCTKKSSIDNMQESSLVDVVGLQDQLCLKEEPLNATIKSEEKPTCETKSEFDMEQEKQNEQDQKDILEMMEILSKQKLEKQLNTKHIEELAIYKEELESWSCLCLTLDDWVNINDKFKKSKKKFDQDLSKLIEQSYLPEMPCLFQKAEKDRNQRLLAMAPKRQSTRLQVKQAMRSELSESESKDNLCENSASRGAAVSYQECNSDGEMDDLYDDLRKSASDIVDIARQREERLKQRLLRRENNLNENSQMLNQDDNSQASNATHYSGYSSTNVLGTNTSSSDFNIRNYFLMHKVLTKILQSKYAWPFKNAVSEDDAPDYNTLIETPMDLSTIQLKINSKTYKSRQAFVDDLELIVNNCLSYNGEDSCK